MTWPTVRTLGGRRSGLRDVLLLGAFGGAAAAVLSQPAAGAAPDCAAGASDRPGFSGIGAPPTPG